MSINCWLFMNIKNSIPSALLLSLLGSPLLFAEEGDFLGITEPKETLIKTEKMRAVANTQNIQSEDTQDNEKSSFNLSDVFEMELPNFHRKNEPLRPEEEMLSMNCEEIDEAITYLIPSTYQYMPDFYDDPYNSSAMVATIAFDQIARYYLPYSWFLKFQENNTQNQAFYHIEKLRRAKAIKSCYVQ